MEPVSSSSQPASHAQSQAPHHPATFDTVSWKGPGNIRHRLLPAVITTGLLMVVVIAVILVFENKIGPRRKQQYELERIQTRADEVEKQVAFLNESVGELAVRERNQEGRVHEAEALLRTQLNRLNETMSHITHALNATEDTEPEGDLQSSGPNSDGTTSPTLT